MVRLIAVALVLSAGLAGGSAAQKAKRADVSNVLFITGPKGHRPHLPGLNAALLLSAEQKEQLATAYAETLQSKKLRETGRKVKTDPNASATDREAVRMLKEQAQTEFDRRVSQVLTAPPTELIGRFQILYAESVEAVGTEFRQRLVDSKGDKAAAEQLRKQSREALNADFARRVGEILTPEQRAAFEKAAADEKLRASTPKQKQ